MGEFDWTRHCLVEMIFPALKSEMYSLSSPETPDERYNCIAWAAGDDQQWWQPSGRRWHYWPRRVPLAYTLNAHRAAFRTLGYVDCDDGSVEAGWEKIALYTGEPYGLVTHAARQNEWGIWLSKLGPLEDIEHLTLAALEGPEQYGTVAAFMKRPRR